MSLSLEATIAPAELGGAPCDVTLRLVLHNTGSKPVGIMPALAKVGAIASFAGAGITWELSLGEAVPLLELRTWYGPPGNPPPPSYVQKAEMPLGPGEQYAAAIPALWIPRPEPRQLALSTLDPQGMDNVAARVPFLATASVLVLNATAEQLRGAKDDFLRGHVVAFFPGKGSYEMRAVYAQQSWMNVGERHRVEAAPFSLHLLP